MTFSASVSYGLEWYDNIRFASTNAEADVVHRPQVNVQAFWPATKDSTLSFGVGVGYQKYQKHSDLDQAYLAPDSELAWDIPVKDFVFTLSDRFLYSQDVLSQPSLSGTAQFPRIENTAGVRARWYPDRYLFELAYAHHNFFPASSQFDYLEHSSEQFFARAGYRFAPATHVGVETSGSLDNYNSNEQPDRTSASLGPFVEWQMTHAISLSARGGYVMNKFERSSLTGQTSDLNSYYVGLGVNHQLTDYITQNLSATRDIQPGLNRGSAYIELFTLQYHVGWAFYRHANIAADFFYDHGTEPQFHVKETFDRVGAGMGLSCQILQHLSGGLAYRYVTKSSKTASGDYQENLVTMNLTYHF